MARLKEARKAAGLSQKEASGMLGVSIGTYRNWEQGRVTMNVDQLVSVARLFGTNVDYLLLTDGTVDSGAGADELQGLYESMSVDGRDALLIVARGLAERFGREE